MRQLSLSILLIFFVYCIRAQTFTIHHYSVAEGLPSSEVYDIFQDSKGFLWFSTDNGVARYDGFQFKTFTVADSLPDPVVFETIEDSMGKIWFKTFSGKIAYVENEKLVPYKFNNTLSKACKPYLYSLVPDSKGQIWYSSGTNWGVINTKGELHEHTVAVKSVFYKKIEQRNIIAKRGTNREGFEMISIDGINYPIQLTNSVLDPSVSLQSSCSVIWNDTLYITVNNNIFKYDGTSMTRVYKGSAPIISLSKDRKHNLWVGFLHGRAIRFSNSSFSDPWTFDFIKRSSVSRVLEDKEGGIWVSTLDNGIYYIPSPEIKHYYLNSDSKVRAVQSTSDRVFIGETNGTYTCIDSKSKSKIFIKKIYPILSLFIDKENKIWVATGGILYILNDKHSEIRNVQPTTYKAITEDSSGTIWAIDHRRISKLDPQGRRIVGEYNPLPYRNIVASNSRLLVGMHTGLNIYDYEFNLIASPKKLEKFKISAVTPLGKSHFLVATVGNGFLVANKSFEQFAHYKLPASNIYAILSVDSTIWMGTEKGILRTTVKSLLTGKPTYDFITNQSGLLYNQVTHLVKSGNEIFAFNNNAFSVIQQTNKTYINKSPTFYIKDFKVNNNSVDHSKMLDLDYDHNNIQLDFGFISFNHQDILTRYRLNANESWNYITERTIRLYSLASGKYSIELQYSIDRINWIKTHDQIQIQISPPWWQSIEFQIALVLGITAIIFLFYNNRLIIYRQRAEKMKLLSKQQQQLIRTEIKTMERERSRIAKDLHDGVGTNILAAKLNVNRLLVKYQDAEINAIEEQFQNTVQEIKGIIYNLSPPGLERYGLATGLKNHIDRIAGSTNTKIELNTYGNELKDLNISIPLFRILQELISNSLKHSNSNHISIHLNSFDDLFSVVYEDSGTGFALDINHKGLGLHSIESRVKSIDGKLRFESGTFGVSYSIDVPIKKQSND